MPNRVATIVLSFLASAAIASAPVNGQEQPNSGQPGPGRPDRSERNPGQANGEQPGREADATVGGVEGYLTRRIEILRERLELTEQLGKLEVQRLEVAMQGHDRRSRHLLAKEEQHQAELEVAEKNLARMQQLRVQGVVSEEEIPRAEAGIREANAHLLEIAVERGALDADLAMSRIEVQTRRIENRLATSDLRLELLETEHELESGRARRARFERGRTSARGRSDAVRATTERREDVGEAVDESE